jgi:hypothetical protein
LAAAHLSIIALTAAGLVRDKTGAWKAAKASRKWPQAKGHICSASVAVTSLPDDVANTYHLEVQYEFTAANGKTYRGNRIYFGPRAEYRTRQSAEPALAPYQRGTPVTVYYHPERPSESTLHPIAPQISVFRIFGWVCIAGFCLSGLFLASVALR